ncbi:MAG: hypothetical protein KAV87_16380 [Desulfobacteraceae bacterium]|nr:hypothetical protein [Desulfobacteraceae bacterium]
MPTNESKVLGKLLAVCPSPKSIKEYDGKAFEPEATTFTVFSASVALSRASRLYRNPPLIPKYSSTESHIVGGAAPDSGLIPLFRHSAIRTASIPLMTFSTRADSGRACWFPIILKLFSTPAKYCQCFGLSQYP